MLHRFRLTALLFLACATGCNQKPDPAPPVDPITPAAATGAATAATDPAKEPDRANGPNSELGPVDSPTPAASPGKQSEKAADKAAAPATGKGLVKGPVKEDEPFAVWLQAPGPLAANAKGELTLVLHAKDPFKCNDQYPYKFKVSQSDGLTVGDDTVRGMTIGKKESTMAIPVTVGPPGKATLTGELSFSVCTEDKCLIEKQNVTISVDVQS